MEATQRPLIYSTIAQVMQEINAISKGRKNQQQGFNFRGIDDVMNELHPVMAKCGLFVVPTVLEENRTEGKSRSGGSMFYTRLKIQFTFYAADGSYVQSVVIGEAMDTGDKASNKALSIAFKYACLQVFCIPTEDEKDPDAQSPSFEKMSPAAKAERARQHTEKVAPSKFAPAGGPDTPEEHQEIVALLNSKNADGTKIFGKADFDMIDAMRAEKPAKDVINFLKTLVADARTPRQPAPVEQTEGQEELIF